MLGVVARPFPAPPLLASPCLVLNLRTIPSCRDPFRPKTAARARWASLSSHRRPSAPPVVTSTPAQSARPHDGRRKSSRSRVLAMSLSVQKTQLTTHRPPAPASLTCWIAVTICGCNDTDRLAASSVVGCSRALIITVLVPKYTLWRRSAIVSELMIRVPCSRLTTCVS